MSKTDDEAYNLIKKMELNNFQWSIERIQPKLVGGKLEINTLTLLSAKVDAITQRPDRMNVNAVNSSAPSPCEVCGSVEHVTLNCQDGSPFLEDPSEVNYVQNFNPRPPMTLILVPTIQVGRIIRTSHISLIQTLQIFSQMNVRPPPNF